MSKPPKINAEMHYNPNKPNEIGFFVTLSDTKQAPSAQQILDAVSEILLLEYNNWTNTLDESLMDS